MKRIFSFADGSQAGRQWNGEFIASLVKKMLILLGIMLLPNVSNAASNSNIRRFVVTKTSFVYIDDGAKAEPGSLAAAVDSVNKYSTDSCEIIFDLKANDTIKVTSYVAKEIANETYTLLDGGKNGAKIKAYNDFFCISGANHVVLKNLEFVKDAGGNALKINSSVVDEITNCKFIDNSSSYGALNILSSTVTSINNCLFSKNKIGLSADTKSSVTVSDCQFTDNTSYGIAGNSNKNLILRNCTFSGNAEGLRSFYGKAYNCVFKNNESASYTGSGNFYNCIFSQNSTAAIQGSANVINKCRFTENGTAINAVQGTAIDSVCYSYIGNNKIGINISQAPITNIIGDTIVSNQAQGIYIGGTCTHVYNNVISDNNVGIEIVRTAIDSICGNTIVSNKTSGVISTHRSTLKVFSNNYIGTNSKFEALGNGEDGIFFASSSTTIPSEFKNNVIGNNGRYGINLEATTPQFTIESCYLGVAPDSTPIPNAKGGLYIGSQNHKTVLKNSSIAMNGGTGVKATVQGELSLSGCSFYANQGYGVYFSSEFTPYNFVVDKCTFDQNDSSAIYTSYPNAGEGSSYVTSSVSNTLFLNTKKKLAANKAIETNNPLPTPVITSIKEDENGYMVISGRVESEGKSFVELYLCDNGEETTSKFLASDSTDAEGNFSINAQRTTFSVIIVATASSSGETSAFSRPYTYFNGNRGNYYVKENGKGDGSNWKAAMSGKDFVKLLPLAPAGVTFHVAAGTYDLKELSGGYSYVYINNPVTIIGGYPADAQTGASSAPLVNTTLMKTGYFRLNTGGNVVFDGLKFDNENYRGAYDANSNGKYGLCVTLKNSIVEGNESNADAVYSAHGGKTILYNDIITGSYTYSAVFSRGDSLIINKCHISGAQLEGGVGTTAGYLNIDSTTITGNECGLFLTGSGNRNAIVTNSVITGNRSDGVSLQAGSITLKNNRIGIDAKGNVAGNRIGVILYSNAVNLIIEDNIIAGNDSIGISIQGGTSSFRRNYIGTDKDFNDLGNGSDGLFIGGRCSVIFPSSLDSANYIGFNKGYGIYSQGNMTACNASFNYIGVTPQGDPMPNGKYGVYLETSRSSQTLKGNVIGFNGAGGVYYSDNYTTITENLFFGTKGKAISDRRTTYKPVCPAITKITRDEDVIRVEGTTDTSWVSTIELFYTNGDPQTAHEFLGRTETDNTGAFSFAIPRERLSKYGKDICLSATATYSTYSQGVSELSDPFCCEDCMCKLDTTPVTDTIQVGASFLGKTYTVVGVNDSIFETLKNVEGCDSVVMHRLVVKPDPTVFNYYVKMESHGRGDGSDWENAMDSIAFAACLPLAPDGVTFHVAAGTYTPIYNESLVRPIYPAGRCYAIKSSVTIRGGYPATAEGDAVSEPDKYKTIFNGDILGEDVVDETLDENGYPLLTRTSALDNTYSLFNIVQPDQQTITFDGVVMRSAERAVDIGNSNKTVNVLNCTFYYNDNVANLGYGNVSVSVYHSLVEKNRTGFSLAAVKDVVFDDVVFKNNLRSLLYASRSSGTSEPCSVTINNVRAIGNGDGFSMMGYNTTVTNSEFESNLTSNTNLLNIMDCQNGLSVKIEDCRFLQNKGTLIYSHHSDLSIENCSFEKNEVGEKKMFCIETPSEYIQAGSGRYVINGSVFKENDASTLIDCHGEETTLNFVNSSMEDNKASVSVISSNVDSLIIDHVKFNHNSLTPGKDFLSAYIASGYVGIKNSEFSNNISALDPQDIEGTNGSDLIYMRGAGEGNTSYVEGNAFWGNQVGYIVTTYMLFDTAVISNNTIVSNELYSSVLNYSHVTDAQQLSLNNNTIIGNAVEDGTAVYLANADVNFTGNIIVGNVDTTGATADAIWSIWSVPEFSYNILPYYLTSLSQNHDCEEFPFDKNIVTLTNPDKARCVGAQEFKDRNEEILTTLFEGTYDKKTNLFTPVLKNNGGPTPTVALKNDLLIDGTSIRFPLKETVVSTDQRGETRVDPTCMGAYEITCSDTETTVQDTVALGDPYTFNGEDLSGLTSQVGIHTISDTIKLTSGCDSIINLQLAVRPQKKDGGYYVKVDGTGDGSDWENAMSPKDFATYLPLVYDGDTFHVAAGTYRCEVEDPVYGHTFCVNKDVTIIGGYPDTVTIVGTPSSPDVYTTLLTANNGGEEYMYMYMNSSFPSIGSFAKSEPSLVRVVGQPHVTLFGLTLSGVKNANDGAVSLLDGAALDMDRCVVTKNQASAIYAKNADVKVTNSEFSLNFTGVGSVFNLSDSKLEVSTSTIYENFSNDTFCVNGGSKGAVAYLNSSSAVFVNNTIVKNRASAGAVFAADGSTLDLTNNTITGNMIEPGAGTAGSVFNFIGGSSNMKLFGNMIVANDKTSMTGTATITSSDYNIFSPDITIEKGANDMTMSNTQVPYVMDVENAYGEEDLYIPILRDNGGITPTVALSQSLFDGGAVLSIPRDVRAVDFDQRGFVRKDTSCVGAFEFPTLTDYYVKVIATGDGSGRDWDNAMSDTTFATYFSIAPNEATFHIAAGTYYPLRDRLGHFANSAQCFYSTTRSINMIGGYPELAKEGDTTDPSVNFTVLSVDHNNDNTVSIVKYDDDYSSIKIGNISDNGYRVIDITPRSSGETFIYGIIFEGSKSIPRGSSTAFSYYGPNEQVSKLTLDHCTFRKSYSAVSICATTVVVNECRFDSIEAYAFSAISYTPAELTLSKSTFNLAGTAVNLREVINAEILNNTIVDARTSFEFYNSGFEKIPMNVKMYNNTVSNGANFISMYNTISEKVNLEAKGNIFNIQKCYFSFYDNTPPAITSDYNIFTSALDSEGNTWKLGEHDVLLQPTDLVGVLDGTYSDEKASFVATLSGNGGFCDNVSLLNVILPDDKSIKMIPTGTTTVTDDQRYVKRDEVYCAGSYEVDCSFSNGNLKLVPSNTDFCRDDTVIVKLEGLSELEANTFKYQWFADNDSVRALDADSNAVKFHLYSHQSNPRLNVTITNACGNDTIIGTSVHVNGTGAVPFSGIEENDIVCQNAAQPIELTTNVAGAVFEGECIVNEHFFDPSLATADTSLIRCWVETGECKSFEDKIIHITKSESFVLEEVEGNLNLTCSNEVGYATLQIMSESEDEFDAYYDTKHIGTYKSNDKIEIKAIEKGSHTLFVESKVEVCPASSSIPLNVSAPNPISVILETQGVGCGATVTAFASGETGLYQYVWKDEAGEVLPSTSEVLSGIGAGTYTCIVSSVDCGTKVTEQATIDPVDDKGELSVTFVKTDETCIDGNNGTVTVTLKASNPNEKVTVVLTSDKDEFKKVGSQRGGDIVFDNLPPTQYVMTAYFGSEDCVSAPTDVKETINIAKKKTKLSITSVNSEKNTCLSPLNGYISATVNGWDNGYVALLNDTPVEPSNVEGEVATFKLESVSSGDYVFYVEDNCKTHSDSKNVSISSIDPYKLEIVKYTDTLDCAKSLMGYAQFKKEGGNEENSSVYIVGKTGWSSLNEDQIVLVSGSYFANLKKDQYTLYYKSNLEGCLDADSLKLTVKGPDTLAADYVISCKEDETVIKITASGENGEYKYRWNGGDFSLETDDPILAPSSLEYGLEYTCEVRDSKGCDMKSFTFSFVHPDKLKELKMRYSLDPQSCIGVPNAKIYAVAAQKEDKYEATFVLMNADDNSVFNKISVSEIESAICFSDLPVGNYQLKLRYGGEDCEMGGPSILSDTIKVEPLLPLKGQLGETTGLTCLNEPNGKAEISLSSGWSKHHISTLLHKKENKWDVYNESLDATSSEGQSALYEINGLEGGSYQFIIKDNCGKDSMKFSFDVSDFEPYSIQLVNKTKFLDCYTDDTAHIEVSVSGGYFFDNEFYLAGVDTQSIAKAENFKYTDLTAGLYHFHYGTTQEGCSDSVMLDVEIETDSIFVNLDKSGEMCYDAKLQATVKGGKEPYTLVWGNENADSIRIDNAQPFVLENVGVANYFATVVDKIGCKAHSETVYAQLVGDMSKENGLRIDSISLNALQCLFPSENGDIRVFVVGNTYRANVSVKVKRDNNLVNEVITSAESDTITIDGLPFDQTYQLSVSFQGAEECAAGNDNLNRSILLTKPEPFSVDFTATKVLCANSHDAEIASNIHAGAHTYHYEWHKLIEDKEDEIITHDVLTSDTLRDLRKEERYFCKVVDQNFCESLSDTFTIGYSKADTMQLDTFEYDERQRCKGVDNAHMYVSFNKVAPWVNAQFDLSVVDGDALDKQDQDENNDRIHINELGPNKYHLIAGYGVEGCPTLLDTIVEIFEMVGDLEVAANPDSTHDALCVSTKDGAIYFHLDGVAKKQVVEIYDEEGKFLKKVQQDSLSVERGFYKLTGLLAGAYKVKVTNDCDVKDSSTYTLGGYNKYELALEEDKSHLSLQCPYSEDGAIAFSIVGHESNFTLNFMTYDTTIIDNYKDSIIVSDCVIRDSTRMKDTIYTMYNRDETSVSVHSSVAPKMETKVIDDQTVYNYYLSVDSILGEVDTFAVVKELLPGTGVQYKYTVKEKSGAIKWELSNISIVDTIAPTEQDGDTLYRFHTMVDSLVCVRDTDNMKMTWNYVMDPNNDTLFLYQYYEIPTKCFDTISVIAGKVVQYHPVLNELDANDATLKDGIYYFTNFKKGDYYIKAKTTMENCPDADTMNVKITAPNDVLLTKEILPVSCRSKNDGSVSLKPYREGSENGVLYFGRDSILFKSNYKANYLYKRTATKHDQNGDNYTSYDYENVIFNGDTVMVNINDLSNYSSYFVKKHDGSNVSVTPVAVDGNVDQATLFGGDIVSVDWKRMNDAGTWETINDQIVWPASTDSLEETYFSSNGDIIKGLVWGASHLETFWDDYMGTYQEVGVQTVANMPPAKYAVRVTDAVGCVYDFDFEVKEPEDALKIESVEYNASLALCKPEERHIFVRASGGWGYYKYSFSAEADTSIGYVVDKYNGGEAYSYDPTANTGWGRSACLVDGIYKVSVFDDKGCIVTVNDPIEVKSLVKVTADTSATLCPGVISAPITLNVSNTNNYSGTYTVKEYLSACGTEISSCINDSFPTVLEHTSVDNLALTVGPGRHGYLVYEDDNNACGGYVEVVVLDTIRPMDISKKSIDSVKCYGNNDGAISLYLKGGTSPYTLSYDKFWFDEKENQSKEAHESRTYTKSQLNLILNNIEKSDGTIVVDSTYSIDINNLSAAKYCFTIVDANGCVRSLGVDGSIDTLTVRQPDSMHIDVYASGSCPDKAGLVTENIAVFGQNAKGGIRPYLYYAAKKGETGEFSDNSFFDLPVHTNDIVTYAFEDANQCHYEKDIVIDPQPIPVERYDFILSTWSQRNDVVALIDLCAPDVAFDSVTYYINDENVEVLDKRMYIYDIHAPQNKELYEELSKVNTKTEVSDMFFQKHFNLCVDSALAKHIQFIRRNNLVTYTWNANLNRNVVKDSLKPKNDSIWVQDEIRMRAYFKGCAYDVTRNGCFIIATDKYQIYNGGLSGETDILDLQLYPNPFIRTEQDECQIRVTVASKTEGDIYLYTLDGKTDDNQTGLMKTHFNANEESGWQQLAGSLYNRPDQPYVYQKTFVVKADDLKSGAEAIVVLVRTANDAKSTYLLVK